MVRVCTGTRQAPKDGNPIEVDADDDVVSDRDATVPDSSAFVRPLPPFPFPPLP